MNSDEDFLIAVLDQIEQREARLLSWGLVDGFITRHELIALVDDELDAAQAPLSWTRAIDVVEALKSRALLFELDASGERVRSRMAEAVRLFFRLRQLFPQHAGQFGWQTAPTLVGDFRFTWRRRRYPRRETDVATALASIAAATSDVTVRQSLTSLLESFGDRFKLAQFQIDAAARILAGLEENRPLATLVSAGTGSGKTLAFYLPALARVASHIVRDEAAARWVKVLALYPRNELLKDQFAEIYEQARRLDASLRASGRRKIVIAAFFGPTPRNGAAAAAARSGWKPSAAGLVCEYVRCPTAGCHGDMVWRDGDRAIGLERLVCGQCAHTILEDEIVLTRERLAREAPDILFTTTEMLNQRMGDSALRHLFGLGDRSQRAVELMLLDEVHTYAGASGAQVAFLLRRWRRMVRGPVSFVGLSATLADGQQFFSRLTGIGEQSTAEIAPCGDDLIAEGGEYLLALRGDPVSRAALLSTTIQTAMLLSRVLDEPGSRQSGGLYGERLFLFTDDIDVTNRMYFAMLDAEGRASNGAVDMTRHPNGGLATLRRPMASQHRKLHGQDWQAAVDIGHSLQVQDRKSVGRVMSLDPGVGDSHDIIVATASLEVGFNDVRVGGVIQHKAPREVAQFLQRKGRAGRSRRMRPWTIAVLSDYGRDRLAYQGYDLLFDPEVPVRSLPTGNRHVRRMQAVYASMDYLSLALGRAPRGSVWSNLAGPTDYARPRERQAALAECVRLILTNEAERDRYALYLARALGIEREEVDILLWDAPRPLLLQVLPTALRRLESNWAGQSGPQSDYRVFNSPLPEFAPANLFSDLNLPEVSVVLPPRGGAARDPMAMPVAQAMREFAPGRVSRRYGLVHALERHIFPLVVDANRAQAVSLTPAVEGEHLGDWLIRDGNGPSRVPVWRARAIHLQTPPANMVDTSNARLVWRTQIVARTHGLTFAPPQASAWTAPICDLHFFTHQGGAPLEMRRMAIGSTADIRYRDGSHAPKDFSFERDGAPAALGFSLSVDGLCFQLNAVNELWRSLGEGALARGVRSARFHDEAVRGAQLSSVDNSFVQAWLGHLMLAALSNEAMAKGISLEQATHNLRTNTADFDLNQTLSVLFQSPIVDDANAQGNVQDRLRQDLTVQIGDPQVVAGLFALAQMLWAPLEASWEPWLRERYAATVAAAALSAFTSLCPDVDSDGLVVDLDAGPKEDDDSLQSPMHEIWITEAAPGGNGHIEQLLSQYAEDPRRFFSLMTAALRDNDLAQNDYQLHRFLRIVCDAPDGELAQGASAFRSAYGSDAAHRSFASLRATLAEHALIPFHSFVSGLGHRILRPGSGPASDRFLLDAIEEWAAAEARLGVELDARVIAYRLSRHGDIDAALGLEGIETPAINLDQWRMSVIYGLLWPRGAQIRQAGLALYSPFAALPEVEPLLVLRDIVQVGDTIDILMEDWREQCLSRLSSVGAVTLVCPADQTELLAYALNFFATNPVQTDYLNVFARIEGLRRVGDAIHVELDIAEALQ